MKINRLDLLNVLQNMQSISRINFKENIIYQIENDIMIYNKFFNRDLSENFSLPIDNLITILSKLKDNEIELNIDNNIKIITKNTEIEFTKEPIINNYEFINPFTWIDLPESFFEGIKFVNKIFKENQKSSIILFDNDKIVSTNGVALIIYNLGINFNTFFLLKKQLDLLVKLKVKRYFILDNLIYFLADNNSIVYFNYLTEYKFPPYQKIKMIREKEIQFLNKLNLTDININSSILDTENYFLNIEIEKDSIIMKSKNMNINIETKIENENEINDKINFKLDINYLIEFLKLDYSNEFKTSIDENKICFENSIIKFITTLG